MTAYAAGLTLFIVVILSDVAGLLVDYWLLHLGLPTITEFVETAPPVGALIVAFQVLAPVGLILHFWVS